MKQSILNQMKNEQKLTPEIQQILLMYSEENYPVQHYLPTSIDQFQIKKITWKDFLGEPIKDSWFLSYTLWNVTYTINTKQDKGKYMINPKVNVNLLKKSWTKYSDDNLDESMWLLNHEQGHYLIGSIVALEFKLQALQSSFSSNYNQELKELFNKIIKKYCDIEKQYDKETYHALNVNEQKDWDFYFISTIEILKNEIKMQLNSNKLWK